MVQIEGVVMGEAGQMCLWSAGFESQETIGLDLQHDSHIPKNTMRSVAQSQQLEKISFCKHYATDISLCTSCTYRV